MKDPHQIEGIGFLNGDVFLGTYGGARIYKYNPDLPYDYNGGVTGDNPEMVYGIPDDQSRPFTFTSGDNKLFVGTISDYGKLGGSLAIYDAITDEWSSTRNVIENQSIIGLAYRDGILFGGSTTSGGLGINPTEDKAKMFAYDTRSDEYDVFELEVEGIVAPKMIGELSIGPDNNLWGIAYGLNGEGTNNSVVFAMNPVTKEVIKSTEIYTGVAAGSSWRPFYIRWDDQGLLYTTAGRKLTVIDPGTMKSEQIIPDTVNLMDLDSEGNIYYAIGADLYKLPVIKSPVITLDSLQEKIESLYEDKQIPHDLYKQLSNQLKQVRHHEENGRTDQSKHHLNVMKKHVEKWQPSEHNAKQSLLNSIDYLMQ